MKEGLITDHELERIITAVEHDMDIQPIEKPEVVVTDSDSDSGEGHVCNLERMDCTCPDYEINCGEGQFCKHLFRCVFEKFDML